ncbi:MAG TPA: nitroreductase family protein [Clostridiales bacterium]|nr:nitroreductase family protein [Clostridiales bacterium]
MDKQKVLDIFYRRRSIRKFKQGVNISDEQMDIILKAAMAAPSANNRQPWYFIVVDDRDKMLEITKHHPYSNMLHTASACIVVVGDTSTDYWVQDCSAATENMLLAIANIDLGGVWLGIYPRKERVDALREIFNIPEHMTPLCVVAVGVPDEKKERVDRFDPNRIYKNSWK